MIVTCMSNVEQIWRGFKRFLLLHVLDSFEPKENMSKQVPDQLDPT